MSITGDQMMRLRTGLAFACIVALTPIAESKAAKTLVFCSEGSPEGFNPSLFTSVTTFDATAKTIYSRLVEFKRGSTDIIPGLAESWTVSADGKTYIFKLRRGVKFHTTRFFKPTRDFNADDVLFTFNRQWQKTAPYHQVSGGTYPFFDGMGMPTLLKSIEKIDSHTVKFTLNRPEAPFIANLAMEFASILSKEYADAMMKAGTPEKLDLQPIGTGPFQFVVYQQDAVIRFRANPNYFLGKAKIENLIFAITPDASVRWAKLRANECQVMPYPHPADLPAIRREPNVVLHEQAGLNVGYLAFNTQKKPFDNVLVRRALNLAIDKKAIMQAVFQGSGMPAKNPIPPTIWSYDDAVKDYPHDPSAAKKLLAKAGFPNGFKTDIWAMPVQRPYNPNARRMAEIIQADWAAIGVEARIVTYEWGEYLKRVGRGEHQTVLLGWTGGNGDPDNFLYLLLSCGSVKRGPNRARWCFAPYDKLVSAAKIISDRKTRADLYRQAQVIFKRQAPWVTIAHSKVFVPTRKSVVGFKVDPFGGHIFYGVDLK